MFVKELKRVIKAKLTYASDIIKVILAREKWLLNKDIKDLDVS